MQLTFTHKLLTVSTAGLLLPLAYAPFDLFWVAPLSYAALFYVWSGLTPLKALWTGFAFGCTSFFVGVHWVYVSIHDFGSAHPFLAGTITVALVLFLACYVALTGWLAARWFPTEGSRAWLVVFDRTPAENDVPIGSSGRGRDPVGAPATVGTDQVDGAVTAVAIKVTKDLESFVGRTGDPHHVLEDLCFSWAVPVVDPDDLR